MVYTNLKDFIEDFNKKSANKVFSEDKFHNIENLIIENTIFENVNFAEVFFFEHCSFINCHFFKCVFNSTNFNMCEFNKCESIDCDFKAITINLCSIFNNTIKGAKYNSSYFYNTTIKQSAFNNITFGDNTVSNCHFHNNEGIDIKIENNNFLEETTVNHNHIEYLVFDHNSYSGCFYSSFNCFKNFIIKTHTFINDKIISLYNNYIEGTFEIQDKADYIRASYFYDARFEKVEFINFNNNIFYSLKNITFINCKGLSDLPMNCPSDGPFVGWKVVDNHLIKLLIPDGARRSSGAHNKCRADMAYVLGFYTLDGEPDPTTTSVINNNYTKCEYKLHQNVYPDDFDEDRWHQCSNGIHFFINKIDAINYGNRKLSF